MTLQIIGGTLIYGRTVQPAQYETKKAECHLQFNVPEGGAINGEQIEEVAKLAMTKVHEMVGLAKPNKAAVSAAVASTAPATSVPATGRTKADIEAEMKAAAQPKTPKVPPKTKPAPADAAEITDEDATPQIRKNPEDRKEPASNAAAVVDDELFEPAAKMITEADILAAVTAKQQQINNAVAIRKLIGKYVSPPKRASDIPVESRAQFLKDLEALTGGV